MGYTHYWNDVEFSDDSWSAFKKDVRKAFKNLPESVKIQREYDDPRKPLVGPNTIRFNGAGDEGCETFVLSKIGLCHGFDFCKTYRTPYDLAVCSVLILASIHAGSGEISSDGIGENEADTEWRDAIAFINKVFPDYLVNDRAFKLFEYVPRFV